MAAWLANFYRNTLLKEIYQHGKMHSVKKFGYGHRKSVVNPKGPTYYSAPHLAHLDPGQFDSLNKALTRKNAKCGRKRVQGKDALAGILRKNCRFPGRSPLLVLRLRACLGGQRRQGLPDVQGLPELELLELDVFQWAACRTKGC